MLALPVVALMLLVAAIAVVWLIVKRPIVSLPIAVYIGLAMWLGVHDAQAVMIYVLVLLVLWRLVHRPSFERTVGGRLRSSWRRLWVYDRRWHMTMVLSGLGYRSRLYRRVPRIRSVRSASGFDRVRVRLLPGQCMEDVERAAPRLAQSFGARYCLVREDRPRHVVLVFATGVSPPETPQSAVRASHTFLSS